MRKFFDKYYGKLRKIKANYVLVNLFNQGKLKHTKQMYRKYGIAKSVLMPVSSQDMPESDGQEPWLDQDNYRDSLLASERYSSFPQHIQDQILQWHDKGFLNLKGLFSIEEINAINNEIDSLIASGKVDYNFTGRKIMFAFKHSELLRKVIHERRILDILDFVMGKEMVPFQSINFTKGSEQEAHSDSIHMTTFPLGYLNGVWIALEEIHADNGPVYYYPGSHKFPYLLNENYDHGGDAFTIGENAYLRYEQEIAKRVEESGIQAVEYHAKPGDVLVWHANLIHGGKKMSPGFDSRKSMVIHYFGKDVLCYHELTQRPAMMEVEAN